MFIREKLILLAVVLLAFSFTIHPVFGGPTQIISDEKDGTLGNANSGYNSPSVSADGRYVAFTSWATNLVPGGATGYGDIYVRDRVTGNTELVSVASDGTHGDDGSYDACISADGRYVAFDSWCSNLVPDGASGYGDIYVHDRVTGKTELVSVASDGTWGNDTSEFLSISANGRYVAFQSHATNLVAEGTNGNWNIYVHDCVTGSTELVSVASDGAQGNDGSYLPSISADGRYVEFGSYATNLVPSGTSSGTYNVYVHDRVTGITELVSVAGDGSQGNSHSRPGSISADGRYVVFTSEATNLVPGGTNGQWNVFVHDRITGATQLASVANDGTQENGDSNDVPFISADGRYVVFQSQATNLVPGGTTYGYGNVYVHDCVSGSTDLVSIASDGTQGNASSGDNGICISEDGRYVVFDSASANLTSGGGNGYDQVYVHDRGAGAFLAGLSSDGSIWYTKDLRNWNNVSGMLSSVLVVPLKYAEYGLAGLSGDGSIWYTSDLQNWKSLPGYLSALSLGEMNSDGTYGLAGTDSDGNIWRTTNMQNWTRMFGNLSRVFPIHSIGGLSLGMAGLSSDNNIWYTMDMQSWQNVSGHLNTMVSGYFSGYWAQPGLAGLDSENSIWYTTDMQNWTNIPGKLSNIVTGDFDGSGKDGIAGIAEDGSVWYTMDLQNWMNIPGYVKSMVAEDLNGDGKTDLACTALDGSIWYTTDLQDWSNIPSIVSMRLSGK